MNLSEITQEFFTSVLEKLKLAWWIEIATEQPKCTYYFGPFASVRSAELAFAGYIEELEQEEALLITAVVKRCQPKELTVFEDELADSKLGRVQPLASQQA